MISFQTRIQLTLPPWWGSVHPNLDATIAGFAGGHTALYNQTVQLRPLMRLNTVTGDLLDIAAYDFYGETLGRAPGETDTAFRFRIKAGLFQLRGIRSQFEAQILALTGANPIVIDPRRTCDTGYIGSRNRGIVPTLFNNSLSNDKITSYAMPWQWFVIVRNANGVYNNATLYSLIAQLMPAGTVAWTRII